MTSSSLKSALNATVIRLGIVALLADISSEMLYPITPIFLTVVLGASFTSIGIIEGVAEGLASFLRLFSGAWNDRFGRARWIVAAGYFLSAIAKPMIGAAHAWPQVLSARALDRAGKGIRSAPRDAWLAGSVSSERRGAAFGWHRGMDSLGATLGPLIALIFISQGTEGLRQAYAWALIPGLFAVLMVFSVKDAPVKVTTPPSLFASVQAPRFKRYLWAWTLFSLANSSDAFLLLKASHQGVSFKQVTLLYCLYNVVYAVGSPYLGRLSDRFGRKPILIFGLVIFAAVYVGYAFATELWQFGGLFLVYGGYMAATDGVGKAMAVDLLPESSRSTGLGWHGLVTGLAAIGSSVTAGLLWDHVGAAWPFLYGAFGAVVSSVVLLAV